jgi:mannose-6-phosphate isomerase-like protein (cupin superfamily)
VKTGKVWGLTEIVLASPMFEMHRLSIKPKHRCSLHKHNRKWNAFLVISGRLYIDVVKNNYPLTDTTELGPGQVTTVPPGEHHMFRTGDEECEAFEFYYTDPLSEDIERRDHGGPIEE